MKPKQMKPYLYLLPALLPALLFVYYPFIRNAVSSFFDITIKGELASFRGFGNYASLFTDSVYWESLKNTFIFIIMFVPVNTAVVAAAVLLSSGKGKLSAFSQTVFILPMTLGLSSAALLFRFMFNETNGIINSIFRHDFPWTSSPLAAMLSLVFLGVFLDLALDYLLLLSAYRNLDRGPVEAAMLDGCGRAGLFFRIKVPMMLPTLSFIVFMALKDALLICAPVMVMTEGGPARSTQTIVYYYYLSAFKNAAFSKAAAISMTVFVMAGILILTYKEFEKRRITYR